MEPNEEKGLSITLAAGPTSPFSETIVEVKTMDTTATVDKTAAAVTAPASLPKPLTSHPTGSICNKAPLSLLVEEDTGPGQNPGNAQPLQDKTPLMPSATSTHTTAHPPNQQLQEVSPIQNCPSRAAEVVQNAMSMAVNPLLGPAGGGDFHGNLDNTSVGDQWSTRAQQALSWATTDPYASQNQIINLPATPSSSWDLGYGASNNINEAYFTNGNTLLGPMHGSLPFIDPVNALTNANHTKNTSGTVIDPMNEFLLSFNPIETSSTSLHFMDGTPTAFNSMNGSINSTIYSQPMYELTTSIDPAKGSPPPMNRDSSAQYVSMMTFFDKEFGPPPTSTSSTSTSAPTSNPSANEWDFSGTNPFSGPNHQNGVINPQLPSRTHIQNTPAHYQSLLPSIVGGVDPTSTIPNTTQMPSSDLQNPNQTATVLGDVCANIMTVPHGHPTPTPGQIHRSDTENLPAVPEEPRGGRNQKTATIRGEIIPLTEKRTVKNQNWLIAADMYLRGEIMSDSWRNCIDMWRKLEDENGVLDISSVSLINTETEDLCSP